VISISQAIVPSFGKTIASGDQNAMHSVFDKFEFVIYFVSTVLFTCGMILITPFVDLYTMDIHDADYHQNAFGVILTIAEMIYCIRDPYVAVSYSAGHFKQISKYAYIEAIMNIVLSLILVFRFGLIGIAAGTLLSMLYRMIAHIYYMKKNIMYRGYRKAVKAFLVFGGVSLLCYLGMTSVLTLQFSNYMMFFVYGLIVFAVAGVMTLLASLLFYRENVKYLIKK
jgi:O-antigen/teichoic acid export membrane protein